MTLFELQAWLGHRSPQSTQHYARITPTTLAKAYHDAGYFARNVRTIEVLIDREAVQREPPQGRAWQYFDLGHGYCTVQLLRAVPAPHGLRTLRLLRTEGRPKRSCWKRAEPAAHARADSAHRRRARSGRRRLRRGGPPARTPRRYPNAGRAHATRARAVTHVHSAHVTQHKRRYKGTLVNTHLSHASKRRTLWCPSVNLQLNASIPSGSVNSIRLQRSSSATAFSFVLPAPRSSAGVHSTRTAAGPNLVVFARSARFVCFRCQVRGDAIAFVQQIEQLSFRDAVQRLEACIVACDSASFARPPRSSQLVNARRRRDPRPCCRR